MQTTAQNRIVIIGVISCYIACIGDFAVTSLLATLYPGYDPLQQSESLLSITGSPIAHWITIWCIFFTFLFILFSLGVEAAFGKSHRGITLLCWLIVIYGIGEGAISGLFPYDFVDGELTVPGHIHAVAGMVGQACLYFVPVVAWYALHRDYPSIKVLSILVLAAGSIFLLLYGATKLNLIDYRGLWQRLFMGVFFVYLMYLAWLSYRQVGRMSSIGST
ncbi:DUF998 domain-containing protein [Pontibacter burrus]|uniref:DUF998 domain-containing protein n=1 Tax=Pontibacter burrus TaxID=2704466 RepID=A0A6B3LV71_9BACT|nr:DUF998 domain-containing protein [Pontibacter burrus]NEM97440.1 DUF998 domain-containing protein [Pontibacter burrus]